MLVRRFRQPVQTRHDRRRRIRRDAKDADDSDESILSLGGDDKQTSSPGLSPSAPPLSNG